MKAVSSDEIEFRRASVEEILPIREEVIIRGTDRTSPGFEGDSTEETLHFGAIHRDEGVIGCLTLIRKDWKGKPALQLRGMAVLPDWQRHGIGKALLGYAERYVQENTPFRTLWCNARKNARTFYEKQGWKTCSEEFIIEGVGPHFKMTRNLDASSC